MVKYIAKRLLSMIPVVLGVTFLVFIIMDLAPGDPVLLILGDNASEEARIEKTRELGLDQPVVIRFGKYVYNFFFKADMGNSYISGRSVSAEVLSRFPNTLKLSLVAALASLLMALPLGIIAAVKQNSLFDNTSMVVSLIGNSMPAFWLGMMLVLVFALKLRWFPVQGMSQGWKSFVLPSISIGLMNMAAVARTTRSSMLETIRQDYIRTARAKGIKESRVIMHHAFRNAVIPTITVAGVQLGNLLGGAVITETVFAWPGLGRMMVQAVSSRDVPMILGCIITLSFCYSVVNLLVDLLYGFFDPRVKTMYT
jgi:peptide/nickel transport system permease protein